MSFFDTSIQGKKRSKKLWDVALNEINKKLKTRASGSRIRNMLIDIYYFGGELSDIGKQVDLFKKRNLWNLAKSDLIVDSNSSEILPDDLLLFSRYSALLVALQQDRELSKFDLERVSKCMMEEFFFQIDYVKPGLFSNWENSCYLDSLLMLFLTATTSYYRKGILEMDLNNAVYKLTQDKITYACETGKRSSEETRKIAMDIQNEIKRDYEALTQPDVEVLECRSIRSLLRECRPEIHRGRYLTQSVSDIYHTFTELFPDLSMKNVKFLGSRPPQDISMFIATDFMDNPESPPFIDWESFNQPVIVFRNGLSPPIDNFNSLEPQKVNGGSFLKYRSFGERILDDKYELFGVIIHKGSELSGHYVAYIKSKDESGRDVWYYYDDVSLTWKKLKELPKSAWISLGSKQRPELFFYKLV